MLAQRYQKRCKNVTKITISLQKDYNYKIYILTSEKVANV